MLNHIQYTRHYRSGSVKGEVLLPSIKHIRVRGVSTQRERTRKVLLSNGQWIATMEIAAGLAQPSSGWLGGGEYFDLHYIE